MANLVAYIPVLNRQHVNWFTSHGSNSELFLIDQGLAQHLLPYLERNMGALETTMVRQLILATDLVSRVSIVTTGCPKLGVLSSVVTMPDEDVSHAYAKAYLNPLFVTYESIWARWDMTAVKRQEPVMPEHAVSMREIDVFRIGEAEKLTLRSPDWWRQIGAMVFQGSELLACGWNRHFPTEYEVGAFGDTRINFDAGDPDGMDAYLSLHAEEYIMAFCANQGISLQGTSMYINTFPCGRCARALAVSGIKELFFREGCSFLKGFEILQNAGIRIVQVKKDPIQL